MPLTPEESAAITESFTKGEVHELLKPFADAGVVFRNTAQETTFKDTYKGQIIKDHDLLRFNEFETAIKEASGLEKLPSEKATDFAKRAISATKTELEELKTKKVDGTATTADKERITALEALLGTEKENVTKTQKQYAEKLLNYRVSGDLGVALAGLKLKADLKGEALQDVIDARTAKFRSLYKAELVEPDAEDDTKSFIQYRDAKTNAIMHKTGTADPATAQELVTTLFDAYLEKGVQQPGAGAGKGKDGQDDKTPAQVTKDAYVPAESVQTRADLAEDLKHKGFKAGTADFTELLNKFKAKYPLGF